MPPPAAYHAPGQAAPRGEVEVFASRAGHTTEWHTDFQHNFTLQLSGRKRWRVGAGAVVEPLRAEIQAVQVTQTDGVAGGKQAELRVRADHAVLIEQSKLPFAF